MRRIYPVGFLSCLFIFGCSHRPKYTAPAAPVPPAFKEAPPNNFKESDLFKTAAPQDEKLGGNWWELFSDPVLNELASQVDISNQQIAAAEAQFRSARAAIRVSRSGLFPAVTVTPAATTGGGVNRSVFGTSGGSVATGTSTGTFYTIPFDLTYEVDAWGRIRGSVDAAVATAQASAADLGTIRLSMQSELALDYFQLRGLDEEQRLFQQTVAGYAQALELTTNRYNEGVASQVDLEQARTQLETARAQLIDLGIQRAALEHAIAILIGKPPADLTLPAAPITGEPPAVPVSLPSELLERRPDIAGAERRVATANAQIGVAQAAFYPAIALSATAGLGSSRAASLFSIPNWFWSFGHALAQTLFDAGRRRFTVEGAEAAYDVTVANYRQGVLAAFQEVEDNLAALRILEEEAQQQELATQSAQRSLDLVLNRYRAGVAIYTEVITAQNALLANQQSQIGIRTRRMAGTVLLIKALGGGWDRSGLDIVH